MDIYLIRHGETEYNRLHKHQSADVPLNATGQRQAGVVADVVLTIAPTHLFASTMTRAQQTAQAIEGKTQLPIQTRSEFMEIRRPADIEGKPYAALSSVWYMFRWFFDHREPYWDKVGGESRLMFLARIQQAKLLLQTMPPDAKVVVVSHSIFINFFVAHICNENPLNVWQAALRLLKIRSLDNSSITHVQYDHEAAPNTCAWTLISFDDDAHVVT